MAARKQVSKADVVQVKHVLAALDDIQHRAQLIRRALSGLDLNLALEVPEGEDDPQAGGVSPKAGQCPPGEPSPLGMDCPSPGPGPSVGECPDDDTHAAPPSPIPGRCPPPSPTVGQCPPPPPVARIAAKLAKRGAQRSLAVEPGPSVGECPDDDTHAAPPSPIPGRCPPPSPPAGQCPPPPPASKAAKPAKRGARRR